MLSFEAEQAGQRYTALVAAWRGIHASALEARDFGTARGLGRARAGAYDVARSFLDTERALLAATLRGVALEAHAHALSIARTLSADELPDAAHELLSASQSYAESELAVQIERDIALLLKRLRAAAIDVDMIARIQGVARSAALIQHRARAGTELRFAFKDRANRKWPSRTFVRTTWRQALLDVYNETVMASVAAIGASRVRVVTSDAPAAANGLILTLLPGVDLPTYAEVRDAVFHPNAEAWLAPLDTD
ncbi:hypothetical protein [Azospirillum argentinense]